MVKARNRAINSRLNAVMGGHGAVVKRGQR